MHFGPTAAQDRLRGQVRAFLDEVSPASEVRRLMETETGFDPAVWRRMASELGLQGIHLPTTVGGGGVGWVELGVVLEEAGRVLLGAPYLSTAVVAGILLASSDTNGRVDEALVAMAAGRTVAALAVAEASGRWDDNGIQARALPVRGRGWRLEGRKSYVVDGCAADLLVVAARTTDDVVGLFLVEADADGLSRAPLATVDLTRKQAELTLAATPATPLAGTVASTLELAAVALAAEQVGGAQRCLDRAVAHAGRRIQFGRPIGSFQAVKHLCAEMLLALESARSAAFYAALAAARGDEELPAAAAVAKSCCSEAYVRVATDSLHVHGGLGFTWDDDSHLYFKRARSSALLFGDPRHHRELLARHLGF